MLFIVFAAFYHTVGITDCEMCGSRERCWIVTTADRTPSATATLTVTTMEIATLTYPI